MKRRAVILVSVAVLLLLLFGLFLKIPSQAGPPCALALMAGKMISSNRMTMTYIVTISNMVDSVVLYPASGLDPTHRPLLALEYQTNADWKYKVDVDVGGRMLALLPHESLRCTVDVPKDVSRFKVGIFRVDLTWRGRLGLVQTDAIKRAKRDWSSPYLVTSNVLVPLNEQGI